MEKFKPTSKEEELTLTDDYYILCKCIEQLTKEIKRLRLKLNG